MYETISTWKTVLDAGVELYCYDAEIPANIRDVDDATFL
jgi:hypothetical protein